MDAGSSHLATNEPIAVTRTAKTQPKAFLKLRGGGGGGFRV